MSLYYTCRVHVEAIYNQGTLLTLIKKGKQLDFIYLNVENYSDAFDVNSSMSPEQALQYLFIGETIRKNDSNFPKGLTVQYLETIFTIRFYEKDFGTNVYFFVLENPWKKKVNNEECLDFGRYIKLWIDMCDDFCIYSVETSVD